MAGAPTPHKSTSQTIAELPDRADFAAGGGDLSSSLGILETSGDEPFDDLPNWPDVREEWSLEPPTKAEQSFRHSGWHGRRRKIWDSFTRTNISEMTRYRFANCGSSCWVQHSAARGKFRLSCNTCKSRWCAACGRERAMKIQRAIAPRLEVGLTRFFTFTIAHTDTPLRAQITKLYGWFNELRRDPLWKNSQNGAVAFLEVKIGRDNLWHPHLHVLSNGNWVDQRAMRKLWKKITKTSWNVDIREPKSIKQVKYYVTKYITKPLDNSILAAPDRLDEAIAALKGRRICNPSGDFGKIISERVADEFPDDWTTIDRLDQLIMDSTNGDEIASAIIEGIAFRPDAKRRHKENSS